MYMKSRRLEEYLSWMNSKNSKQAFVSALKKFCSANDITSIDNYFISERDFKEDIKVFADYIRQMSPKTQNTYLSHIKIFFENQKEFETVKIDTWFNLARKKNGLNRKVTAITISDTPNNTDLKIMLNGGGIREKAVFGLLAVTGLRVNEALNLTFNDVNLNDNMIKVRFESAKNGHMRYVFFTDEVKQWMEQWINHERNKWIETSYSKSKYVREKLIKEGYELKKKQKKTGEEYERAGWTVYRDGKKVDVAEFEKRIFPFSYPNTVKYWHRLLEKTGYNQKDGMYYHFNIHCLRRFFCNTLKDSGINPNYKNYFSGHISDLEDSYENYTKNYRTLKDEYSKNENIFGIFTERALIDSQMTDLQKQINEKEKMIEELQDKLMEKEHKYSKMEDRFNDQFKMVFEEMNRLQDEMALKQQPPEEYAPTKEDEEKTKNILAEIEKIGIEKWRKQQLRK